MKNHRSPNSLCVAASLLLLGFGLRPATAQLLGPEFQVNTYSTGVQFSPAVAADGSGNFVVAWRSVGQDGSSDGVFGQRFNSAGSSVGSEFQVNTYTTGSQTSPAVAVDGLGNFVVVWESYSQGANVFGQRFSSAGSPTGSAFQVNTNPAGDQIFPAVAADSLGNFVVVWETYPNDVFGQRFDSAGSPVGSQFQVDTNTTHIQAFPSVAMDNLGNFIVVWDSDPDGGSGGVFGQRFNSAGSPVGSEFQANTYTTGSQGSPAVAVDGSGNFVVTWNSDGQDGSGGGVFGQRFDSAGSPVGSEFQVNSYTTNSQFVRAVAADGSGNFVVVWGSWGGQDGSLSGVFGQRFSPAGHPVGSEFQVNSYTTNYQGRVFPALAVDGSGNFVVVWESRGQDGSNDGVFGQRLSNWVLIDGFELGDACAWSAAVGGGCP